MNKIDPILPLVFLSSLHSMDIGDKLIKYQYFIILYQLIKRLYNFVYEYF